MSTIRHKVVFVLVCALLCLNACGKKGPLKAPEDVAPGVKAGVSMSDGAIFIKGNTEEGVLSYKIERIHGVADSKREIQKKVIFEGKESPFSVKDADIKAGEWYIYKIIPELKKGRTGKIYISTPVNVTVLPMPPANLRYEIIPNKGAIVFSYDGAGCEEFKIFRHAEGAQGSGSPYAVSKTNTFRDEFPLLNVQLIYEVRCVSNGMESGNNPTIKVVFQ
jgi:predicted small lipoprotein YifL